MAPQSKQKRDGVISDLHSKTKPAMANYESEAYEIIDTDEIVQSLEMATKEITEVFDLPPTTTRILLSHLKWDKQRLMEKLLENREGLFSAAKVIDPFDVPEHACEGDNVGCNICFVSLPNNEMFGVDCGHKFCSDCWKQYLTVKIGDEGAAQAISCPEFKCKIIVDDVTVMELIDDPKIREKYQQLMTSSFVQHNKKLRWCPGRGCSYAAKIDHIPINPIMVTCKCGSQFCFECGSADHEPVPCELLRKWKESDMDENVDWLTKNTKPCPKCTSPIEKNGGCHHMKCRSCDHHFCWWCYADWKVHGYDIACNRYVEKTNLTEEIRLKLKFRHYYKRYAGHKDSLKKHTSLMEKVEENQTKLIDELGMRWIDVQFLPKAVQTLVSCRKHLMNTYIFANYAVDSHQKTIFEDNQSNLEISVENLAQHLEMEVDEKNVKDVVEKIMCLAKYCDGRKKTLQTHIEDEEWTFA